MTESFEIKRIRPDAAGGALKKAEHYRLLNEPQQAESICLDILEVQPGDQVALVVLILAITDQFGGGGPSISRAREYVAGLESEYERAYYTGIIYERQARSVLGRMAGVLAYGGFREAMTWYEKAEGLRPADTDDPILRWNSCVRAIEGHRLEPRQESDEQPLE